MYLRYRYRPDLSYREIIKIRNTNLQFQSPKYSWKKRKKKEKKNTDNYKALCVSRNRKKAIGKNQSNYWELLQEKRCSWISVENLWNNLWRRKRSYVTGIFKRFCLRFKKFLVVVSIPRITIFEKTLWIAASTPMRKLKHFRRISPT